MLHDSILDFLKDHPDPICISCLSAVIKADFNGVMHASRDMRVRQRFNREHGTCSTCGKPEQIVMRSAPPAP